MHDNWFDQAVLFVLNVLNEPWLTGSVAVGTGLIVAYLARRSPKGDWEYIKEGPAQILGGAFVLLALIKVAPRAVTPTFKLSCDRVPGPLGISVNGNCRWITGPFYEKSTYGFGDAARDFLVSSIQDEVLSAAGTAAGIAVAVLVLRHRNRGAASGTR